MAAAALPNLTKFWGYTLYLAIFIFTLYPGQYDARKLATLVGIKSFTTVSLLMLLYILL
jgi:hypothetical protein